MASLNELFEVGLQFHGHKCPAMPMGLRAGLAAMETLAVERAPDKELFLWSETGKGHAAGCFLDGLMCATGCTYGKSNIQKLYHNKLAFTLVDIARSRGVRVAVKPDFLEQALASPFVQKRKAGVPPQEIPADVVDPLVERILSLDREAFLDIGEVQEIVVPRRKGVFETGRCQACGEVVFVDKLRVDRQGRHLCRPCAGWED